MQKGRADRAEGVIRRGDQWIRRRLRAIVWKQWKSGPTRFAKLRRCGVGPVLAAQAAGSPRGPWRLSNSPRFPWLYRTPYSNRSALQLSGVQSLIHRTAVYGPVRMVVWEGWSRETPSYPDRNDKVDDSPHRDADRIDRDPDVVAIGRDDGCDRHRPGLSARGNDLCDRCAGGVADLDRAPWRDPRIVATAAGLDRWRRRAVRLSCAVFPGAALCAARRSWPVELSLAASDRAVLLAAAGRAAGAASYHRCRARPCRHRAAVCRQSRRRLRSRASAGAGCRVRRGFRLGELYES